MLNETLMNICSALGSIGQFLVGAGTLLISIYLLIHQRRTTRIITHEAMLRSFNEMLRFGLQTPENLKTLGDVLYPDRTANVDTLREYLTSLTVLNALEQLLVTKRNHGVDAALADNILRILMTSLLQHPVAREAIRRGTYDRELSDIADNIISDASQPISEPEAEQLQQTEKR